MTDATAPDPADGVPDFADVSPDALVQVGFVFRPHGLNGELKIDPELADDPEQFERLPVVYLGPHRRQVTKHGITSVRYQHTKRGTTVLLGLDDIDSRDAAEAVTKFEVFATEEDLELGDAELLAQDLIGMEVVTEEGALLGTIANFKQMPAQDVLVVRKDGGGQAMIPVVEDFLLDVDEDAERVVVRPIEGLLE